MLIIDRFEGDFAVCEQDDRSMVNLPKACLPPGAQPGSVLVKNSDGRYALDLEEEEKRRIRIRELEDKIFGQ